MKRKSASRIIALLMMVCLVFTLSACGNGGNESKSSSYTTRQTAETESGRTSEETDSDTSETTSETSGETSSETTVPETTMATQTQTAQSETTTVTPVLSIESTAVYVGGVTGDIYYSKNENTKYAPASIIKIVTALIAIENCSMDEIVTYSAAAVDLDEEASVIDAVAGEQMSMKDCLYGLMIPSGCDCANAIAEHISGSVSAFCNLMNQYAAALGCTNTCFSDPSGVDDVGNYTTARDMYLIAVAAFSNPVFLEITSTASYTISATNMSQARTVNNTNYNIVPGSRYFDARVIAGKTGMTLANVRNLVAYARDDDGRYMIIVLLGCPSINGVFPDVTKILNYL